MANSSLTLTLLPSTGQECDPRELADSGDLARKDSPNTEKSLVMCMKQKEANLS